jgi:hypothetical protein
MWMRLRHWWYAKGKPEAMPREVREYAIRRYLAIVSKGNMSPQEKDEAATRLYVGSVNLAPDQVSIELRGEMAAASVNLVGQIPGDNCILCKRPLFKRDRSGWMRATSAIAARTSLRLANPLPHHVYYIVIYTMC